MQTKVVEMLKLIEQIPELEVLIFSGEEPINIIHAINGENPGTYLHG
jgi:isopentenyl phosphate kinase